MSTVPRAGRPVAGGGPKATGGSRSTRLRRIALAALAMAVLVPPALVLDASVASAAPTFTVTSTVDAPDAAIGNGVCATAAAVCSLRAAVAEANATTGAQIVVPAGTYLLNSASGTDTGDLDLRKPMTITGAGKQPGAAATTINGNAKDRVFEVLSTGVVLDGLVITNGNVVKGNGGGILVGTGSATVRNSTVTANKATDGAGIQVTTALTLDMSTVSANVATGRGGGVNVDNSATLAASNSTFDANSANGGGGVNSSGTARLDSATVTANTSNNSNGGGIARNGGSFTVSGSVLAANNGVNGRDCYGSPMFAVANIVQNTPGCNPSGTPLLITDPKLGAMADNGGATRTRLPSAGSPAIDAYAATCVTAADQRNVSRTPPPGGRCDIGSVEVAPLSVGVTMSASAPARNPACPTGSVCVGAGVAQVPTSKIPTKSLVASSDPADSTDATYLRRTYLRRTDLLASPVSELTLQDLYLRRTYLRRTGDPTPVEQLLLSDIPLYLPDGRTWEDLLAGTEFQGVPLQNITLSQVLDLPQVASLTIGQADISTTALKDLSGVALALAPLSLDKLPLGDSGDPLGSWCTFLADQIPGGCAGLNINPSDPASASDVGLVTLQLAGLNIESLGLESIYLRRTDLSGTYLRRTYLRRTDLSASAIGSVYLRRTGNVDSVVDCTRVACDGTVTLAKAQAAGAIKDTATVGDLLDYLAAQPDTADLSILDLMLILTPELFPGDGQAFEQIDLNATPLQPVADPAEPPVTFTSTITVTGVAAGLVVAVTLPPDFQPVAGSATLDGASIPDGARSGQVLTFRASGVAVGQHTLSVAARAGLELGTADASVKVDASAAGQDRSAESTTGLLVVESFERNDTPDDTRTLGTGSINVAHIDSAYDGDLYSFYVSPADAAAGATDRIDLSNLARDYDLVLYGPKVPGLRAGTPKARIQPVDDTSLGFDTNADRVAPDVQRDVPLNPPPDCGAPAAPQACVPYAVSAQRGNGDELIESGTLVAGTYWVEVQGYNGAFGPEPYVLRRIEDRGTPLGACAPRTPSPASAGPVVAYPAGVTAATSAGHLLVPAGRFRQQYGAPAQTMLDKLNELAARTGNDVVTLDADPGVKAAYDAWDANPCSVEASNNVVRAIGRVLDSIGGSTSASVTLIGNHIMTPQALVPDGTTIGNENSYNPGVQRGKDSSTTAALKAGYVFTDTPYGASSGYAVNASELYVPDRPVGRLVETPGDITASLQRFLDANGVLDPETVSSAFVSGYDFVADGARATAAELRAQGATVNELDSETWTRADLRAGLIGGNPDIASLSGHFDHNRALPALGNSTGDESDTFTTSDVTGAGNLARALVFSIGCHSGLSVPDVELALTDKTDWAQVFSAEGAAYLANTGYGYGDSDLVAFSERLQVLFTQQLRTGAPTGAAMMAAKQAYFSELAAIGPYDAKVLAEYTMYGLPMWTVGGAFNPPAAGPATPATIAPSSILPPDSVAQTPVTLSVGTASTPKGDDVLTPNDTGRGTYYDVNGNTLNVQYRPAQPFIDRDVTAPGRPAHGVVITDAESTDLPDFSPYYVRPNLDQTSNEQLVDAVGDAVFPSTLARVTNPVSATGTPSSTLTLATGQFRRNGGNPGTGTQRLFTRLDTEVTYADASVTDFDAPTVVRSEGAVVGRTVGFTIRTSGDTNRVYVLYKVADDTVGSWAGVDLVRTGTDPVDGSAVWTGGAVLSAAGLKVEFLGQAVDAAGNVAYTDNKTSNFLAAPSATCSLGSSLAPASTLTASGWYVAPDGVTVRFATPGTEVSVDGGAFIPVPVTGIVVTGEGVHRVRARSRTGTCTVAVPIDTRGPSMSAKLDPAPNAGGWNEGTVTVALSAVDPGGSGVERLTYAVNGGAATTVTGTTATVPVSAKGSTTVTYSAVDAAGNAGAVGITTVKIDGNVPTVTSVINPAPVNGWNRGPVTVGITAQDAETGIREIRTTVGAAAPVVTPGDTASVPVGTDGITTVAFTAVDRAGNEASGSTVVRVDSTLPTATITSPPASITIGATATAGFTCADQGSGVASCTARVTGPGVNQAVTNGQTLPTGANGSYTLTVTATDVAGNTTTATRTYSVAYGVCLLYDASKPQPTGGTYVLKFNLCNAAGANLSSSQLSAVATLIDGTILPPPNFQGNSNFGFVFRLDGSTKSYNYNLDTTRIPAGSHTMGFTVNGVAAPNYVLPFILR